MRAQALVDEQAGRFFAAIRGYENAFRARTVSLGPADPATVWSAIRATEIKAHRAAYLRKALEAYQASLRIKLAAPPSAQNSAAASPSLPLLPQCRPSTALVLP